MNLTESFEKDNFCNLTVMACSSRLQSHSVFSNKNLVRTLTWSSALCRMTNRYGRDQLICLLDLHLIKHHRKLGRNVTSVWQGCSALYKSVWRGKTCGIPQTPVEEYIIYSKSVTMQFSNSFDTDGGLIERWLYNFITENGNSCYVLRVQTSLNRPSFNEHIHMLIAVRFFLQPCMQSIHDRLDYCFRFRLTDIKHHSLHTGKEKLQL